MAKLTNLLSLIFALFIIDSSTLPVPIREQNDSQSSEAKQTYNDLSDKESALLWYFQDIVSFLVKDPKFAASIAQLTEEEMRVAKFAGIADEIEPHLREQLKVIKYKELERLTVEINKQMERDGGAHNVKLPEHIDVMDENFTAEDLRKLIRVTLGEIESVEKERKQAYKVYEMEKQAKIDAKLQKMTEEERVKFVKELEEARQKRKRKTIKHPGSREHWKDVWADEDHLPKEDFNPRTFFALHDTNSDGFLDTEELIALINVELSSTFNTSDPNYDEVEKRENVHLMLQHIHMRMDKNKDSLVSLDEYLSDLKIQGNAVQKEWEDVGDQTLFTQEELQNYEREYAKNHTKTGLNNSAPSSSSTVSIIH